MSECEHCGSTDPQHGETHAVLDRRRAALGRSAAAMVGVLTGAGVATAAALTQTGWPVAALGLVLSGAVAWAAATAGGVVAVGLAQRRTRPAGPASSLAVGALTTAALTPVTALAIAAVGGWLGVPAWSCAACAGVGWLLASGTSFVVSALRLRTDLLAPGQAGERARALVTGRRRRGADLRAFVGVLLVATVVAVWVALLSGLPLLVLVLVPLHVAVAALAARSAIAARRAPAGATLPG